MKKYRSANAAHTAAGKLTEKRQALSKKLEQLEKQLIDIAAEDTDDGKIVSEIAAIKVRLKANESAQNEVQQQIRRLQRREDEEALRNALPGKMKHLKDVIFPEIARLYEEQMKIRLNNQADAVAGKGHLTEVRPNLHTLSGISGCVSLLIEAERRGKR